MSVADHGADRFAEAEVPLTLEGLYRAHAPTVARWAAHLGGPAIDVEDVVHEIFIIVRRRLPEFRGEAKPTTWLYRITERVVRDCRRKERFRRWIRASRRDQLNDALIAPRQGPAEDIERRQGLARVYAILDAMPDKYRQMLILFELEEMSGEEIAALTGMKLATVWVRLHRARQHFRVAVRRRQKEAL
jgi:RNA polymerase sigma-70 factor (ECF subfamily)